MPRTLLAATLLLATTSPLLAQSPQLSDRVREYVRVEAPAIALTNVRVIDGTGAPPAENQTIVLRNGRIEAVGPAGRVRPPAGAEVLDLRGHTVIPGIVGLHDHTFYTTPNRSVQLSFSAPRLYLASGVTTIRTTGASSPYQEINLKRAIEQGREVGPRMHITGPYITGMGGGDNMYNVSGPDDARRVVAYWGEEGATWFKAYNRISREELKAAIEEAHRRGLKVTGHLCSVSFREAVALGIDNLEHGLFTNSDYDPTKVPDVCPVGLTDRLAGLDVESDAVRATIREMVDHGVAMTSTLAVYELFVPHRPPLDPRLAEVMAPEALAEYMASRQQIAARSEQSPMRAVFAKAMAFERAFVEAGGLLAAGVDPTGNGGALPGFGDQRNYELLLEAGFSPAEAIRIMTHNGAKLLGEDDRLGTIEAGKLADLAVIRGDPVSRPAEIRNVTLVFKDGIGYDSQRLIEAVKGVVGIR